MDRHLLIGDSLPGSIPSRGLLNVSVSSFELVFGIPSLGLQVRVYLSVFKYLEASLSAHTVEPSRVSAVHLCLWIPMRKAD